MRRYAAGVDLAALREELSTIELQAIPDGSGSSHLGGPEGWIHGLSMARIARVEYAQLGVAIAELRDVVHLGVLRQVMVNRLSAGNTLEPHRDGLPQHQRFHLPVITHPDVFWWDEIAGKCTMEPGYWYGPVNYCGILHMVANPSPVDRVHVIADFE